MPPVTRAQEARRLAEVAAQEAAAEEIWRADLAAEALVKIANEARLAAQKAADGALRNATFSDEVANCPHWIAQGDGDAFDDDISAPVSSLGPSRDGFYTNGGYIGDKLFLLRGAERVYDVVADHEVFPLLPAGNPLYNNAPLLVAPDDIYQNNVFVKRIDWHYIADRHRSVLDSMLYETYVCDVLARHPHPSIARYLGVRVRRGRVVGLVFERLPFNLRQASRNTFRNILKPDPFFRSLKSALAHLHALGLAYNDLKPTNIMVRDGLAVLVDFGSTAPVGHKLEGSLYTPGWARAHLEQVRQGGYPIYSDRYNDVFAVDLLIQRFSYEGVRQHYQ